MGQALVLRRRAGRGWRSWAWLLLWPACRVLARRLPYALKKAVLRDAWEQAHAKRGGAGHVQTAVELFLAYDGR